MYNLEYLIFIALRYFEWVMLNDIFKLSRASSAECRGFASDSENLKTICQSLI
jgi:hypothetical protein